MGRDIRLGRGGLAYRRHGAGHTVVLVHGIPGSAATWDAVLEALPSGIEAVVPDLLGFGSSARSSDPVRLHAAGQAGALADLLDELGMAGAAIVGHDFGGPVALTLSATRPDLVGAIGLLATNAFTDTPIPFPLSAVTVPVLGPIAARLLFSPPSLALMLRQGVGDRSVRLDRSAHLGDRAQSHAIAVIFRESLTRLRELYGPVEARLQEVSVPAFVGWGDHDPFFPVQQGRRTADAIGTSLRVYEGAGHFLPQERPHEVAADVGALVGASAR